MEAIGQILIALGWIGAFFSGLFLLILQFQTSFFWGLACLLVPLAVFVFVVQYWEEAKPLFLANVCAWALIISGHLMRDGTIAGLV